MIYNSFDTGDFNMKVISIQNIKTVICRRITKGRQLEYRVKLLKAITEISYLILQRASKE